MTPKEKAIELVDKYSIKVEVFFTEDSIPRIVNAQLRLQSAKQCALIAVDEMINILKVFPEKDTTSKSVVNFSISRIVYLVQVKQEIEKL